MILGPPLWGTGTWGGTTLTVSAGTTQISSPDFTQIDHQRAINCYPEVVPIRGGTAVSALVGIPGLATVCSLPTSPVRALFAQDGRAFAVAGTVLYELLSSGSYTVRGGGLIDDGKRATIHSNGVAGHQLYIASGRRGGVYDTTANTWTPNVRTDADDSLFVDGYFLSLDATTSTVYQSDLEDGTTWGALAKLQRNYGSDLVGAIGVANRMVYLFGSQTMEVWYNAGTSPFAFAPVEAGLSEVGCVAPKSVTWCDGSLMWLGTSAQGPDTVWRSAGYQATLISTHALSQVIHGYTTTSDAVGWAYTDRGHAFYLLSFPTAGTTWAYDTATGLWSERAYWNTSTGLWEQYKPRTHCYAFGKHLVGDGVSGVIYELSSTTYTDAGGTPLRRLRQGPYIMQSQQRVYHHGVWMDLETGVGNSSCLAPKVMFEKTDDKGITWDALPDREIGAQGVTTTRVEWKRLGCARQRAYRLICADAVPFRVANPYLDLSGGDA